LLCFLIDGEANRTSCDFITSCCFCHGFIIWRLPLAFGNRSLFLSLKSSVFCILLLAFFEDQRFLGILLLGGLPCRLVVWGDIGKKRKAYLRDTGDCETGFCAVADWNKSPAFLLIHPTLCSPRGTSIASLLERCPSVARSPFLCYICLLLATKRKKVYSSFSSVRSFSW
jgi:hypothetical protein